MTVAIDRIKGSPGRTVVGKDDCNSSCHPKCSFTCGLGNPPVKRWSLFQCHLNLHSPCNLFSPMECSRRDLWLLRLGSVRSYGLCFCFLGTPCRDCYKRDLLCSPGGWEAMCRWERHCSWQLAPAARHHGPSTQLSTAVCALHGTLGRIHTCSILCPCLTSFGLSFLSR